MSMIKPYRNRIDIYDSSLLVQEYVFVLDF